MIGGIRHPTQKIKFSKKKVFWLFIGATFPDEEKSSSAVCLVLAGKGPFLQKTVNFGQKWPKWHVF